MGLSRLEAFLKSVRGNLIHVDPNALDSTDSIENDGSSQMAPFKTINRALAEAARFSYQSGLDNDRFGRTTILVYPGEHFVDNRPGAVIDDDGNIFLRSSIPTTIQQWSLNTIYDLSRSNNDLYKLNSVHGGLILPRGVSLVAKDPRKTIIRPLYVPNPVNDNIERSSIFRVTGASFFFGFTILDGNPNGTVYRDYTTLKATPNFSHHKLTCFEYADGVNNVVISDDFNEITTSRTDLDMFYEKISLVYGQSSGRPIEDVNYGDLIDIDIQPVVDEFRIVGSRGKEFTISEIQAGNGVSPSTTITVTLSDTIQGISVDTPIEITGAGTGYDGQFVVYRVLNENTLQYRSNIVPEDASPTLIDATLNIVVDTVSSASPYIFNVSLRSVYGMCGLHADGSKADGFKSMVVAQFTGIGVQKDDNAFVLYDEDLGEYKDSTSVPNLYKNSRARFKPEYENYHIKVSEGGFCQLVSIFAIGFANQFLAESGGDYSITNSNSNFGARALVSSGFNRESFPRDDVGFITQVISPKELANTEISIEFSLIDTALTAANTSEDKLYLYNEVDEFTLPQVILDGYRIGSASNEILYLRDSQASIVIPDTSNSYEKSFDVSRDSILNINNISSDGTITLTSTHSFVTGEKVRVISNNGHLPDKVENKIYYAIVINSVGNDQIKLSDTFDGALNDIYIIPNSNGGSLKVVSRVSDKNAGEIGHPVQWDSTLNNWYITVLPGSTMYDYISSLSSQSVPVTNKTYIKRIPDKRRPEDTVYKFRYIIPQETSISGRPPLDGYIIQNSNKTILDDSEISSYFNTDTVNGLLTSSYDLRNPKFISNVTWDNSIVTVDCELNHNLRVGSTVVVSNVIPEEYNGVHIVSEVINSKQFSYNLTNDPGPFANETFVRDQNLPYFQNRETKNTFKIYSIDEIQEYVPEKQPGIYDLILIDNSISPIVSPFTDIKLSQPIKNLYPQIDRDNPVSNFNKSISFADSKNIGEVVLDDERNSITRESLEKISLDFNIGFEILDIYSNAAGTAHTITTSIDHGFSKITRLSIVSAGSSYIPGNYYGAKLLGSSTGDFATASISADIDGSLDSIVIMDGGSSYEVGQQLTVIPAAGIGTTSGFNPAVVQVTSISSDIDQVISLIGNSEEYSRYNGLYVITEITSTNSISVTSADVIANPSQIQFDVGTSLGEVCGKVINISNLSYNSSTGIAVVTTSAIHGLKSGQKVKIKGYTQNFYNQEVTITSSGTATNTFKVNLGIISPVPALSGTGSVLISGYDSTKDGTLRGKNLYGGITSTLVNAYLKSSNSQITVQDALTLGLRLGDYIQINDEILRISAPVTNNNLSVFRSQLGTFRQTHIANSVVRKLKPIPVEFRRNSIIRASGHTFEYVGFGPGNYSTAFPERQDRKLSTTERVLSQAIKYNGGVVYYSGTDDSGDFYTGNKKISSATGREEVFESPLITFTGEEGANNEVISTNDVFVSRSIRVDGGKENNVVSEFNAPVIINKKLTSYSSEGIESPSFFIQGDLQTSRKYSISEDLPTYAGNYGDIIYRASPNEGENIGWVYTTSDRWRTWGYVGDLGTTVYIYSGTENGPNNLEGIVDKLKFVGDPNGFGIDVDIQLDPVVGFGTIILRNPIDIINFGTNVLGSGSPTFTTRSPGTRLVYQNSLSSQDVDYSTGVNVPSLSFWNSVPRNNDNYKFQWYGGQTLIATLSGAGNLSINGQLTASGINAPITGNVTGNITGNVTGNVTGNATSSNQVKTVTTSTDDDHFVTFVDSDNETAANETIYTNAGIKYNPSDNILTTNLSGNATSSDQVKTVRRDVADGANNTNHYITFVDSDNESATNEIIYTDANISYNPSTKILTANINGGAATANSATTAENLNRSVTAGNGLTGGGSLNGQSVTLDVVGAADGGITVNADSIEVDSTVVRTSGDQTIAGAKTFTSDIYINEGSPTVHLLDSDNGAGVANHPAFLHCNGNKFYILRGDSGATTWTTVNGAWPLVIDLTNNNAKFGGEVSAVGDVIAFVSDIRLKENIEPIDDALNKVLSLSGFTYNFNELAQEKGFDGSVKHSGVSAQEVKKVLPEAVRPAPIDDNYMTVQYEKLVPLLIEAIKEQNQKIESLEKRIQQLGG